MGFCDEFTFFQLDKMSQTFAEVMYIKILLKYFFSVIYLQLSQISAIIDKNNAAFGETIVCCSLID